jgi:hypothetical protein
VVPVFVHIFGWTAHLQPVFPVPLQNPSKITSHLVKQYQFTHLYWQLILACRHQWHPLCLTFIRALRGASKLALRRLRPLELSLVQLYGIQTTNVFLIPKSLGGQSYTPHFFAVVAALFDIHLTVMTDPDPCSANSGHRTGCASCCSGCVASRSTGTY